MSVEINGETYRTFSDYMKDERKVSAAERNRIEFEADLIGKLIETREEKGLSQRGLAELSGMKQPQIARLESMKSPPNSIHCSKSSRLWDIHSPSSRWNNRVYHNRKTSLTK